MSKAEKTIINEFSKRDNSFFIKLDKGGTVVTLDVENFIAKKQTKKKELNNEDYYKKLNNNLTHENTKVINDTIETYQGQQILPKTVVAI